MHLVLGAEQCFDISADVRVLAVDELAMIHDQ